MTMPRDYSLFTLLTICMLSRIQVYLLWIKWRGPCKTSFCLGPPWIIRKWKIWMNVDERKGLEALGNSSSLQAFKNFGKWVKVRGSGLEWKLSHSCTRLPFGKANETSKNQFASSDIQIALNFELKLNLLWTGHIRSLESWYTNVMICLDAGFASS